MKKSVIKGIGIWMFIASCQSVAFDINNGKALHDANCLRCHNESLYISNKAKIDSYKKLHERVSQCELMEELTWFHHEINDVTA